MCKNWKRWIKYIQFRKDTDILEASQQLELAKLLVENGKKVIIKNSMSVRKDIESLFPSYFIFED
jgi:hypothetical protein